MKVLVADDNDFYLLTLSKLLEEWGHEVVGANNGKEAYAILSAPDAPKLAILDWVMPSLSGPELCKRIRLLPQPESPYLIILADPNGTDSVIDALKSGADDFMHKPFDCRHLQARLQVGMRILNSQTADTLVFTFARSVEAKSPYTKGHSDRVTHYVLALARKLGFSDEDLHLLRRGALLHDIGKMSIPDHILDKPGSLTVEEFDVIKQHPVRGVDILKPLQMLADTLPLVRWHHERCDGKGYPDGLTQKEIPFLVRLLSVADVYDALTSNRPYRAGMSHLSAARIMKQQADEGGLDPKLVAIFLNLPVDVFTIVLNNSIGEHFHSFSEFAPLLALVSKIA